MKNIKKAAMFGLDARIALAIFGALSVISGAALYSAIEQAKLVSIHTEIRELEKAIEAYMLDVGTDLPQNLSNYDLEELVVSTATGWNGPYVSLEIEPVGNENLDHGVYGDWRARWWNRAGVYSVWIEINQVPTALAEKFEIYIDGELDNAAGNVQLSAENSGRKNIYYKTNIIPFKQS